MKSEMCSRAKFISYALVDLVLTALSAALVWFYAWFCYGNLQSPGLSGIPLTIPQLKGIISQVSWLSILFAGFATLASMTMAKQVANLQSLNDRKATKFVILWALSHWPVIFLPSFFPAYDLWILHTTFKP